MQSRIKTFSIVSLSALLGAAFAYFVFRGNEEVVEESMPQALSAQKLAYTSRQGSVKRVTEVVVERQSGRRSVRIVESELERPNLMEAVEEAEGELPENQRQVVLEMQKALDADDLKALREAIRRFHQSVAMGGLGGEVPRVLREQAVSALGWFGKDAVVDLVDFMADEEEEVSEEAMSQFEMALQDSDLSDFERSGILSNVMLALTDSSQIDSLLMNLENMRTSVKGNTILTILSTGSEQAKAVLLENLEFYTETEVKDADDVRRWMAENPDDEGDAEFYGGAAAEKVMVGEGAQN